MCVFSEGVGCLREIQYPPGALAREHYHIAKRFLDPVELHVTRNAAGKRVRSSRAMESTSWACSIRPATSMQSTTAAGRRTLDLRAMDSGSLQCRSCISRATTGVNDLTGREIHRG
jgi:hypothetical protein